MARTPRELTSAELYADDPLFNQTRAAAYLGISPRTLRDLNIPRVPMCSTGTKFGYRRSALNRHLAELEVRYGAIKPEVVA